MDQGRVKKVRQRAGVCRVKEKARQEAVTRMDGACREDSSHSIDLPSNIVSW